VRSRKTLKAIDLFSGCGGLTLGLQSAGFHVIAAVENEPLAAQTYRSNHASTVMIERDIREVTAASLLRSLNLERGELDLLAGCPPCQGFSRLWTMNGTYKSDNPMNDLVLQFQKFIGAFLPKAVMIENVPALAKDGRLKVLGEFLHRRGYSYRAQVCDAADYGVPQRRLRMILIAQRGATPEFAKVDKARTTVKDAIGALQRPGQGQDPLHDYAVSRSEEVTKRITLVPLNGGSRADLPAAQQLKCHSDRKHDGFSDIYGRMSWSKPSPTITGGCINPSKGRFLHPSQHRAITLREAALLQGFPRGYKFDMSRGRYHAAQMIGNAFPPRFAERHARIVAKSIHGI
jgi:DNA (cytosine-5)-methyltransferase 1